MTVRVLPALFQLTKPVISVSVAVSAITGYLLCKGSFDVGWHLVVAGVFCLSAGASVINHIQEARADLMMERTSKRPIPSGVIKPVYAAIFAILLILAGMVMLFQPANYLPLMLGLFNILWYNAVYTPLKRVTAFAAIPGAVVGAIPPMIGWTAAGCSIIHPHIIILAFLFFIGQIPHFWLIMLRHAADYEKAGFPTLRKIFTERQITNLTLIWIYATAMAAVLLVISGIIQSMVFSIITLCLSALFLISFYNWVKPSKPLNVKRSFIALNIFYLCIMLMLVLDKLLA